MQEGREVQGKSGTRLKMLTYYYSFRKDISVLSAARTSGTATICKVCAIDTLQPHRFLPIGIEYVFQAYSRALRL